MNETSLTINNQTALAIRSIFLQDQMSSDVSLQLTIRIDSEDINVREFADYLNLIDNTYGRLSRHGIYSYSHHRRKQVEISKINFGSVELQFIERIVDSESFQQVVWIYLLLKYLPVLTEKFTASYKNYQEARLTRSRRKELRLKIQTDEELRVLDKKYQEKVIQALDLLLEQEERFLIKAQRFAVYHVKQVVLSVLPKNKNETK